MLNFVPKNLIALSIFMVIPVVILYFIIKIAVKKAIRELKNENIL